MTGSSSSMEDVAAELRKLTVDFDGIPVTEVRLEPDDVDLVKRAAELLAASAPATPREERHKASHVGAPAVFTLELACQELNRAFAEDGAGHCYLVGSALERPDRRDIDVRLMLPDEQFDALFPRARGERHLHEHDPRWLVMSIAISKWLSGLSGLPVDFQFQRQTQANETHKARRDALGMIFAPVSGPGGVGGE